MRKIILAILISLPFKMIAQQIILKNDLVQRTLAFDGKVWRTVRFSNVKGDKTLNVKSEEVNILPMNSDKTYSISDFQVVGKPATFTRRDTDFLSIRYIPIVEVKELDAVPDSIRINYFVVNGQPFMRKNISLFYNKEATVDRLETERFTVDEPATGGGRGEPVFVNDQWFFGLEYPAGYTRHTDGNTPKADGRYYEKVGNYSYVNLEGRDIEPNGQKGMIRLMHFPGYAVLNNNNYRIISKTAVAGVALADESGHEAFMRYIATLWKAPRSFLHFNNWFEPQAKDLSGDGLINIWRSFKTAITPYGVKMDAMVVDDGWQNRKSIWEPSTQYFPNGYEDMKILSQKLRKEGVGFGVWLSLNGYTNNIDWGVQNGYKEAKLSDYFKQYGRNYSLSGTKYKTEMLEKIPAMAKNVGIMYFKHDFNDLSDIAEGNNHPPTERHGHEATLDASIEILLATKKMNPQIYQNLTNWVWFSPWWLQYADYLWMLAGDDGTNGNWPEISTRAMASTDRDTYIWRMFGNPADRPLIPISRLMTHGIIKTSTGMMESKEDNIQDWAEYVLMYYGRGTLLKEWYISPSVMKPDQWKALCRVDGWAKKHRAELNHTVFVGGRPDEGDTYGYIGWEGNKGMLVARNPRADAQKLTIPFDKSIDFKGTVGVFYKANVVFPYQDEYPATFTSGKNIEINIPGYATIALEFEKGKSLKTIEVVPQLTFSTVKKADVLITSLTVPKNVKNRCDLMVIGRPDAPVIKISGRTVFATRSAKAKLNNFAGYAKSGMPSDKATPWIMFNFDLLPYAGQRITIEYNKTTGFESYMLAEQIVNVPKAKSGNDILWAITNDTRRKTIRLF
ncbi:hypothetical protein HDF18_21540 [Mucilaginibacter sp. X5P1]|uniref:hypothetical protein n=1 Tax=Mucilaginibacter sp. X5P1 TaxID=2723088 RepID=UPI0016213E4E|nr:hypothetical protein [Mucilaginibacter sp. X5P1]MBB6140198.1 hypothetical protein [Mucilaginibacter sp. X5P1]